MAEPRGVRRPKRRRSKNVKKWKFVIFGNSSSLFLCCFHAVLSDFHNFLGYLQDLWKTALCGHHSVGVLRCPYKKPWEFYASFCLSCFCKSASDRLAYRYMQVCQGRSFLSLMTSKKRDWPISRMPFSPTLHGCSRLGNMGQSLARLWLACKVYTL